MSDISMYSYPCVSQSMSNHVDSFLILQKKGSERLTATALNVGSCCTKADMIMYSIRLAKLIMSR